mmetsp:Transcript_12317/g.19031  ORF Transcript_12317/g.19031 Transcript_12317/m.19031 type:complete len:757 (-) Transcript_12317:85-2355(-)
MSMFGVVGGGLAAYKMKKRTQGLSEWRIRQEYNDSMKANAASTSTSTTITNNDENTTNTTTTTKAAVTNKEDDETTTTEESTAEAAAETEQEQNTNNTNNNTDNTTKIRGLHAHVCISGWLHAPSDFQTPWGVTADDPPIYIDLEVLQRYFAVYQPEKLCFCPSLLQNLNPTNSKKVAQSHVYQQQLTDLYNGLADVYDGAHPERLLPLVTKDDDDDETTTTIAKAALLQPDSDLVVPNEQQQHSDLLLLHDELNNMYETNSMLIQMERMNQEMMFASSEELSLKKEDHRDKTNATTTNNNTTSEELLLAATNDDDTKNTTTYNNNNSNDDEETTSSSSAPTKIMASAVQMSMEEFIQYSIQQEEQKKKQDHTAEEHADYDDDDDELSKTTMTTTTNTNDDDDDSNNNSSSKEDDATTTKEEDATTTSKTNTTSTNNKKEDHKQQTTTTTTTTQVIYDWSAHYSGELYTVTWESRALLELCQILNVLATEIGDLVAKQIVAGVVLAGTVAVPSTMVTCLSVVDDPYQLIRARAQQAGIELAHCLLTSEEEQRPMSLVGYSFGACVVLSCLDELAKHQILWEERQKRNHNRQESSSSPRSSSSNASSSKKEKMKRRWTRWKEQRELRQKNKQLETIALEHYPREPAGIVEDVVVMGLPETHVSAATRRLVVSGRFVNCYKPDDYILVYMVHVRCWKVVGRKCGGIAPLLMEEDVENVNVADLVTTHSQYGNQVAPILHRIGYGNPVSPKERESKEAK